MPKDTDKAGDLFKLANIALEKAEEIGGNSVVIYKPELMSRDKEKIKLETDLRKAIENNEFLLYYQPQIDVVSSEILGVEAIIFIRYGAVV